jgi:hypothetical protein
LPKIDTDCYWEESTARSNCAPDDRLRDEAIHPAASGLLRFASLAMTVSEPSPDPNRKTRPMHRPGFEIKAL